MSIVTGIKHYLKKLFLGKATDPETAYDYWSGSYDNQPDNLMLALDEAIFTGLLEETGVTNKVIVDVGCGTGRHWKKIFDKAPQQLIGYDVSHGMLNRLRQKFPRAETHRLISNELHGLTNESCDVIISTLTVAHIREVDEALKEWCRVLKPGGDIIITDYHPGALAKGAKRTFSNRGKTVAITNYVHSIEKISAIAKQLQLVEVRLIEKQVDETMRPYYEKQQVSHIFEAWKGVPIIYGIHLKKKNDPA